MRLKTVLVLAVALLGGVTSLRMHAQDLAGGKERIRSMIRKELEGPARLPSMAAP